MKISRIKIELNSYFYFRSTYHLMLTHTYVSFLFFLYIYKNYNYMVSVHIFRTHIEVAEKQRFFAAGTNLRLVWWVRRNEREKKDFSKNHFILFTFEEETNRKHCTPWYMKFISNPRSILSSLFRRTHVSLEKRKRFQNCAIVYIPVPKKKEKKKNTGCG